MRLIVLTLLFMTTAEFAAGSVRPDIEYGRAGDFSLRMDASIPDSSGPHPAVIVVHGGGWVRGDRLHSVEPILRALTGGGFAWFSISYRFATDMLQFGAAIDDVQTALNYVRARAVELNIDPKRIALVGESAGAHLASMAALRSGTDLRGVVALYSPSDLVSLAKTSPLVPDSIRQAVLQSAWAPLVTQLLGSLSPNAHVKPGMPPFLLIHGTADPVVPFRQSEEFCALVKKAGEGCELYPVTGAGHGIRHWEGSQPLESYKSRMVAWLRERLKA
jgi:acetyl esterase